MRNRYYGCDKCVPDAKSKDEKSRERSERFVQQRDELDKLQEI
jgi:hypothetical protein